MWNLRIRNVSGLDWILISVLALRLILEPWIYSSNTSGPFNEKFVRTLNPFWFLSSPDQTIEDQIVWFIQDSQIIWFVCTVVFIFLGKRFLAAGSAIIFLLSASVIPSFLIAAQNVRDFGYINPVQTFVEQYFFYSSGAIIGSADALLSQAYYGIGLVLSLAFLVFYAVKELRNLKRINGIVKTNEPVQGEKAKMNFCSQCGESVAGASFCPKCGQSLHATQIGNNPQSTNVVGAIPRTSPLAIAALVLSFFISFLGLILGYVARNEIRRSQGSLTGDGLALAAIIIGWIWSALATLFLVFWFAAVGADTWGGY